ncbi:hypothetical protein PsYK624_140700 [Phanerochaete sordida]|uniref:Uncharacterized protein n=1 Tax=Phanerochaete sordida TaxID=48140 RepID=A0A9P3GL38_9APHY|nr:hypothetical protein PsYK624_140700 [Phanerochaete sordida]
MILKPLQALPTRSRRGHGQSARELRPRDARVASNRPPPERHKNPGRAGRGPHVTAALLGRSCARAQASRPSRVAASARLVRGAGPRAQRVRGPSPRRGAASTAPRRAQAADAGPGRTRRVDCPMRGVRQARGLGRAKGARRRRCGRVGARGGAKRVWAGAWACVGAVGPRVGDC